MTGRRTKRDLADEAWLRVQQMDITGALADEPTSEPKAVRGIPKTCPHCQREMTLAHGWTIARADKRLICGQCGGSVIAPEEAVERLQRELQAFFAKLAAKKAAQTPKRAKRSRGSR